MELVNKLKKEAMVLIFQCFLLSLNFCLYFSLKKTQIKHVVYWVQCDVVFTDLLVHHGAGLVCYQDWLGEIKIL